MATSVRAVIQGKSIVMMSEDSSRHLATFATSARKSLTKRVAQWEATNDCKVLNLAEILAAK